MAKYHKHVPAGDVLRDANGHTYQLGDYHRCRQKLQADPGTLTDEELGILESFDGTPSAEKAAEARQSARTPAKQDPPAVVPEPRPAAAGVSTPGQREARMRKYLERASVELRPPSAPYHPRKCERSYHVFADAPWSLTDDDIEQLRCVSLDLAERAEKARAEGPTEKHHLRGDTKTEILLNMILDDHRSFGDLALRQRARADWLESRVEALEKALTVAVDLHQKAVNESVRLTGLVARVAQLEARPTLEYQGVWEKGRDYPAGAAVTCGGSVWIARTATNAVPGMSDPSSRAWTLAVKAGRPGRDAAGAS